MRRHTFADWLRDHQGQRLLRVRAVYAELYGRWDPRSYLAYGWLPELWYYATCRAWRRYNVLRIATLPPTWTDADERLLHGMFQILADFVELERPFDRIALEHQDGCDGTAPWQAGECARCGAPERSVEVGTELRALYR